MAGYVATGTVKSVKLHYDYKLSYQKHNNDVFLEVEYNDGMDWDKKMNIFGNFNKNKNTWGGALKLKMFFEAMGIKEPMYNDDWSIPDSYLDRCVNKEFLVLSYPSKNLKDNGKPYWNVFPETMAISRGMDTLKQRFEKQIAEGWVKDYKEPEKEQPQTEVATEVSDLDLAGIDI